MLQKKLKQLLFWKKTFCSSKNPDFFFITVSTQVLRSTTVFNSDDDKKCFLSTKSSY